jgi:hypothetical protein
MGPQLGLEKRRPCTVDSHGFDSALIAPSTAMITAETWPVIHARTSKNMSNVVRAPLPHPVGRYGPVLSSICPWLGAAMCMGAAISAAIRLRQVLNEGWSPRVATVDE